MSASGAAARRPAGCALIVLAGGRSTRWAGQDKTAQRLAGRTVLAHAVAEALDGAAHATPGPVVVVAPADHPARAEVDRLHPDICWTLERPAGGGPVAGLAAGLEALPHEQTPPVVVLVAGDMPSTAAAVRRLLGALARCGAEVDAVVGCDQDGVRQPLLGAYRRRPLSEVVIASPPRGRSMRAVLGELTVREVEISQREGLDLDTPHTLDVARRVLRDVDFQPIERTP